MAQTQAQALPKTWMLTKADSVALPLEHIHADTTTDFAMFVLIEGQYVLFASPTYKWDQGEIDRLLQQGHAVLYYHTIDQPKVDGYRRIAAIPVIDTTKPPQERILNITDVGAELTKILFDYPLTAASFAKGSEIAKQMVDVMREDNTCVAVLGKLANHDWYTYYHSARVAAYALSIAIEMGLTNEDQLQEISMGCLFHDVGKSKIALEILNKSGPLNDTEWTKIRMHPEHGIAVIDHTKLGVVPREIILHHHERLDGGGYPHHLTTHDLMQEVRIASFADTFDALTTNRPYQPSRSRYEALDLIRHRFLQQLDQDCFKAMLAILQRAQ